MVEYLKHMLMIPNDVFVVFFRFEAKKRWETKSNMGYM